MAVARLSRSGRRPRRGSLERPLNTRLVRVAGLVVVLPLLLLAFTVARPGALPAPALPPSFDGAVAAALARELAGLHPSREPGSVGAAAAADWYVEKTALYGLPVERDTWSADVPGLGRRTLRNVAVVVEGETPEAIAFVAHHDNSGDGPGTSDDASGVATLVELARSYAVAPSGAPGARPRHTLVFLSADGGAFGDLGAQRFARTSRFRDGLRAVVVLDAMGGPGEPRLEPGGDGSRTAATALVRTAAVRLGEQLGEEPGGPGVVRQLVDLGLPFAFGGQAPFLGAGVSAVRLTTADDSGASSAADRGDALDEGLLTRLGRGAQGLLGSLDGGVEVAQGTAPSLYLGTRAVRGWALALVLVAALVPFAVGVVDLLARCRRRGVALAPAFRALLVRCALWLWAGLLVWGTALAGILPDGPARPFPPAADAIRDWPVAAAAGLAVLVALPWALVRRRPPGTPPASPEEELAGAAAALAGLGAVAGLTAVANPYALVFVAPSLYAWLWLPQVGNPWVRDALYGLGLAGPVLGLVSLAGRFGLGLDVLPYAASLVTTGYVPWTTGVLVLLWGAVAAQTGAVTAGRYVPLAAVLPPLAGRVRRPASVRAQASRR